MFRRGLGKDPFTATPTPWPLPLLIALQNKQVLLWLGVAISQGEGGHS